MSAAMAGVDGAKLATAAQRKGDQAPTVVYHLARARDGASGAFSRGAAAARHGDLSQGLSDAHARRERRHAQAGVHACIPARFHSPNADKP